MSLFFTARKRNVPGSSTATATTTTTTPAPASAPQIASSSKSAWPKAILPTTPALSASELIRQRQQTEGRSIQSLEKWQAEQNAKYRQDSERRRKQDAFNDDSEPKRIKVNKGKSRLSQVEEDEEMGASLKHTPDSVRKGGRASSASSSPRPTTLERKASSRKKASRADEEEDEDYTPEPRARLGLLSASMDRKRSLSAARSPKSPERDDERLGTPIYERTGPLSVIRDIMSVPLDQLDAKARANLKQLRSARRVVEGHRKDFEPCKLLVAFTDLR